MPELYRTQTVTYKCDTMLQVWGCMQPSLSLCLRGGLICLQQETRTATWGTGMHARRQENGGGRQQGMEWGHGSTNEVWLPSQVSLLVLNPWTSLVPGCALYARELPILGTPSTTRHASLQPMNPGHTYLPRYPSPLRLS